MSLDVNKIITESIAEVINEGAFDMLPGGQGLETLSKKITKDDIAGGLEKVPGGQGLKTLAKQIKGNVEGNAESAGNKATKFINSIPELEAVKTMNKHWSGKIGNITHPPEKKDLAFETMNKLAKKNRENENMGAIEHLTKAGQKAVKGASDAVTDAKGRLVSAGKTAVDAVKDHPYLSAAAAAALAAGAGGLAAIKKMRKAAKKK